MTCQWFLQLFETKCAATQLYHIQHFKQQGKVAKPQPRKDFCWEKIIFKKISLLSFEANVNTLKRTSLQALWNMLQPLKHQRRIVLILRNDFLTLYGEWQRWKWKQVGIYSGWLTLNSWLKINFAQFGEQRFLKC